MAQVTGKYETIMVLSLTAGEEAVKGLVDKFTTLISNNATIDSVDDWGKRRLAYPINDETEGYYYLINFTSKPDFPAELDRVYKITDGVLRTIIVVREENIKMERRQPAKKEESQPVQAEAPAAVAAEVPVEVEVPAPAVEPSAE